MTSHHDQPTPTEMYMAGRRGPQWGWRRSKWFDTFRQAADATCHMLTRMSHAGGADLECHRVDPEVLQQTAAE